MNKPVWEGIYKDIHEVKAVGNGFNSFCWVNNSKVKVEKYLAGINESNPIPPFPHRPTSLPLLAAMFKKSRDDNQVWFFNVADIITCVESYGYTLEYKSKYSSLILGKMQEIHMSNFPSEYQLDHPYTLLFRKGTQ